MKCLNKYLKGAKTIIFFDLEGTQTSQEIIAIGAIKADLDNKYQIKYTYKPFKAFVKASHPVGYIIEKMTHITDQLLEKEGLPFEEAIIKFSNYIGNDFTQIKFLSYGSFDAKLIKNTFDVNHLENSNFKTKMLANHIDFSRVFSNYVKSKNLETLSLLDALEVFKVTPYGSAHDPAADAINLMLLYQAFLKEKGIVKEEYRKIIINNPKFPSSIHKLLKDIEDGKSVNLETLDKYIEEEL